MKKMYKNLLIAVGLGMSLNVSAQAIPTYVFTQSQSSYLAITGGTVFNNSGWDDDNLVAVASPGGTGNPATGVGVPIGFNFTFGGIVYDVFGVSNNGFIYLGQSSLGSGAVNNQTNNSYYTNAINLTSSTAPTVLQNRIGAFANDLYGTTANGGSNIRIQTLGTSPTRTCVVQFTNITYGGVGMNFQICMYEGSNSVVIVYDQMTGLSGNGSVGLRGSAVSTDFNMRTVSSPNNWSTSNPAVACTDVCNVSATMYPVSGQKYRWDPPVPCTGIPAANTIVGPPQSICPNTSAGLSLANPYITTGISYQWQQATLSNVGPFTPVLTGTNSSFSTPSLTANTWYNAIITCTNPGGGSYTTAVNGISIQGITTNTAPYSENFDGILTAGRLPNCSWAVSNTVTCLTYTSSNTLGRMPNSGTNFASFYNSPAGINYFYSNGIYMTAGITYSASLWFETEYFGYNNWSDLSILYGTTQTPTGLVSIVSTNGPAISNVYKLLSGTFQVPTTGFYYIAVRGTGAGGSAPYLTWDDLKISIPCVTGSPNTPTVSLSANTTTLCQGDAVNLTATGADTYTWDTGSNATGFSDSPLLTHTYVAMGTNTLTGCMSSAMQVVTVYQTPSIFVAASSPSVCLGSSLILQALGGSSYIWSNGSFNSNISVSPTSPTTYTVLATGSNGCTGSATYAVALYPPVNVTASSSNSGDMCIGETVALTAVGTGVNFLWASNASPLILTGNPVTVSPNANSVYTVTATDANGCQKSSTVVQNVNACTGIATQTIENGLSVYPNPTSGEFSIESNNTFTKIVEVVDLAGKVVLTSTSKLEVVKVNIKDLPNGVYYAKVQSNNSVKVLKIVKQ